MKIKIKCTNEKLLLSSNPQEGAVLSKNETAEDVSNRGEHIRRGLNNVLNNY